MLDSNFLIIFRNIWSLKLQLQQERQKTKIMQQKTEIFKRKTQILID